MFSKRSAQAELLDASEIPRDALIRNLQELHVINTYLGGYKVLYKGIKRLISGSSSQDIRLLDIGSGGGDTLRAIYKRFHKRYFLALTGVDLKKDCIEYARMRHGTVSIRFLQMDYRDIIIQKEEKAYDILTASLFCHHLTDEDLIELLRWMNQQARIGFILNDLHRHPLAYYSIKWLTSLFSSSYLVKHDGPLSVLRSFRRAELERLMQEAGIEHYEIKWIWAFRWLVVVKISS